MAVKRIIQKTDKTSKKSETGKTLRENERKWTKLLIKAGWTLIPNVILEKQQALNLDALDINILIQISSHWWTKEELPRPGVDSLADRVGASPSTVRRHIREMEKKELIKRIERKSGWHNGQQANYYDLRPLIEKAKPFAREIVEKKKKAEKERKNSPRRMKPDIQEDDE